MIANGVAVFGENGFFAPGAGVEVADIADFTALSEELFNHAKGDAEVFSYMESGAFAVVVRATMRVQRSREMS